MLALAGAGVSCLHPQSGTPRPKIIDTHTHFYDPSRPDGVPWPPKNDPVLYRTILPPNYQSIQQPVKVDGTVVVEASPLLEDNQWILDLAAKEKFIVGFVGNLPVGTDGFAAHLKRFAANPVFRGIRVRPAPAEARWFDAKFLADLRLVAELDLSLDVVGGRDLLDVLPGLAKVVPTLRIVIDHLAGVKIDGKKPDTNWVNAMQQASRHSNVFCKVSGLVEGSGQRGGKAPHQTDFYRPTFDAMWDLFGEDRLIYGSNWPVCEHFADLGTVQRIAHEYFAARGPIVMAKVFSENARRAYKWIDR